MPNAGDCFSSRTPEHRLPVDGLLARRYNPAEGLARVAGGRWGWRRDEMTARVRDVGIPVRSVNWVHLHAGQNREGAPRVYTVMGQQAENLFVLVIDPETGAFRQLVSPVPR